MYTQLYGAYVIVFYVCLGHRYKTSMDKASLKHSGSLNWLVNQGHAFTIEKTPILLTE